ncbi:MAG: hypothetical protein Q4D85_07455 [Corynebacterium sp.]|uniref:hypothetical protein n=1 Tax=Corynebacterium sp. TaxID=1720 RepID=UPI0026DBE31A|nr:hypothetical protein [Corynebacterium sp.]MDO5098584.1 hypothetical protein [Corynebacterium sp.]
MKFTSNYYDFFGHRVRKFTKEIIPECLDLLDRNGMAVDVAHDRPFPRKLIEDIRDSETFDRNQKVELITVVIGLWRTQNTEYTVWTIAPYREDRLSEGVCIALEAYDGTSCIPVASEAMSIVDSEAGNTEELDLVTSECDFEQRQERKRSRAFDK